MKTINNELIRSFEPCYDPSKKGIPDNETLSAVEWVSKYRGVIPDKDILWLLLRKHFYSAKDLRLFAVWCAREALKLIDSPDPCSVNAVNVAERYANGDATYKQLASARAAAADTYAAAVCAGYPAYPAADTDYYSYVYATAITDAYKHQLDYLLTNFTML